MSINKENGKIETRIRLQTHSYKSNIWIAISTRTIRVLMNSKESKNI